MTDSNLFEFLETFRYTIWLVGGVVVLWLTLNLPTWSRIARYGSWVAQRDYALWRVRNGIIGLVLLVPLLVATTVAAFT